MHSDFFTNLKFEPVGPSHSGHASGKPQIRAHEGGKAEEGPNVGAASEDAPCFTANGQPRASRAAQFMPFAALTGYYELARQQERIVEPRHELTEEEALSLSRTMSQVRRGDLVHVTFYDWDAYRTITGVVARIDMTFRRLQVIKTVIPFDDILSLERDATSRRGVH